MASTIKLKTGTGSAVPSALAQGEVGINIDNGLIYYGSGSGNSVKQLESFTNITASGTISASLMVATLFNGQALTAATANTTNAVNFTNASNDVEYGLLFRQGNGTSAQTVYADSQAATPAWNPSKNILTVGGPLVATIITASANISASGTGSFGELEATGNTTVDGDVFVSRYIRHTGDNDTHIEFLDNKLQLHAGNLPFITLDKDASTPYPLTINNGGNRINFRVVDKDSNLLLKTNSEEFWTGLYFAGNQKLVTAAGGIDVTGNITASGNISASGDITASAFKGDGSGLTNVSATLPSGVVSGSAQIADVTLTTAAQTNITSLGTLTTLTVDDITINGSTISDGADLTIDAEGDITLDANGADVILKDDGTEFGRFKRDSSDFVIKSATNDKDIVFRGVDDSSTITALTLDMSDAGHALFTGDISGSTIRTSGDIIAGGKITGSHFQVNPASAAANEVLFEVSVGGTQKAFIDEDGDASFDGTLTCNILQVSSDGNQSAPAIKFGTDINTGIYQPADNKIALQANGSTTELTVSTDGVEITNGDFIINETIVHSGDTDTKVDFTTNNIQIDAGGTTGLELDITGSILHNVNQNVFDTASLAISTANGAMGDIVKFGGSTTIAGGLYFLNSVGGWTLTNANSISKGASASLAVAVGTNSTTHGMCLRGFINPYEDPTDAPIGGQVFMSDNANGRITGSAPGDTNDIVRVVGHRYGTDLIYFNPSNDFIVHA